jgi:hypothetical protein
LGNGVRPAPRVVEGREAVAVGQAVELELPGLGGIAEPGDEQDVRSVAAALDPELSVAGLDHLSHR